MQAPPKVGEMFTRVFLVEVIHTVNFEKQGLPPVLSTPSLLWELEHTAHNLLHGYLEPDELSVGIEVDLEHLEPSPLGAKITCQVRVVDTEGSKVFFELEAYQGEHLIAKGLHKRRVLHADALYQHLVH